LIEALHSILVAGRSVRVSAGEFGIIDGLKDSDRRVSAVAANALHQFATRLVSLVTSDSRFGAGKVKLVRGEGGAFGFYPNFVSQDLVRHILESENPAQAIRWLQKILNASEAFGTSITSLWGVPVVERIALTDNVDIVPMADLPDSPQKQWAAAAPQVGFNSLLPSALGLEPPVSALVTRTRISPIVVPPDQQTTAAPQNNVDYLRTYELFREITLALTAVGPRVPIQVGHWFTFEDPDFQRISLVNGTRTQSLLEIIPRSRLEYPPLDPIEGPSIVQGYLALHGRTRNVVRVALQRIIQAQIRHGVGDRAVELCTALESLLGDNQTTEMTHNIKSRSARLFGGDQETRVRISALIAKAYDIRSSLVHTGFVDEKKKYSVAKQPLKAADVIDQGIITAVEIIKRTIRRQKIPDWSTFDVVEQIGQTDLPPEGESESGD
jgi:Apea-like HEPN